MERGFKSRCEEISRQLRVEIGLAPIDPLTVIQLADYLDVSVWSVSDIGLDDDDLRQLVEVDADSWSAITVSASGSDIVIYNPSHFRGRYASDVMHELAHLVLGHDPTTMFFVGDGELALRGFNPSTEEEANWLAGTLLLPRDALVYVKGRKMTNEQACARYGVSSQMLEYRMRMTGVNRQFGRRPHRR